MKDPIYLFIPDGKYAEDAMRQCGLKLPASNTPTAPSQKLA